MAANDIHPMQTWRAFYYAGTQRIAEHVVVGSVNTLCYLHSDYLGSMSVMTCGTTTSCGVVAYGAEVAHRYYYPIREERPGGTSTLPTTFTFTGQRAGGYHFLFYPGARYVAQDTWPPETFLSPLGMTYLVG